MKYLVNKDQTLPLYLQLYRELRADIECEVYPFACKLPSKRSLAQEAGVSLITVEHAYDLLREEGYVESRERSGYRVIFRSADGFAPALSPAARTPPDASADGSDAPLVSGTPPATSTAFHGTPLPAALHSTPLPAETEPDLPAFPFSTLATTARHVIAEYGEATLVRSPNQGCFELRRAIARYLAGNQGIYVDASQIVIGSGAEYLYTLIVGLLGRDRIFALESPSYEKIAQVYALMGVSCELLPLAADGIESAALAETAAKVLHITPYRSYPTGITAPLSKRREYLRWADAGDRYIVEDDFESEFSVTGKPVEPLFSLSDADNVIYLNTFSKTISPALRMGYMVLSKPLAERYAAQMGFLSCTVPTFDQLVVAQLIEGGDFGRHVNRVRRAKRKELFARRKRPESD